MQKPYCFVYALQTYIFFIYTDIHRTELCCEASGGAGRGGGCHILEVSSIKQRNLPRCLKKLNSTNDKAIHFSSQTLFKYFCESYLFGSVQQIFLYSVILCDPSLLPHAIGAFSTLPTNLLGQDSLRREGILDLIALDQKGIVSRGRSPIAFNFRMVYKKINNRQNRSQIGTVLISKQA